LTVAAARKMRPERVTVVAMGEVAVLKISSGKTGLVSMFCSHDGLRSALWSLARAMPRACKLAVLAPTLSGELDQARSSSRGVSEQLPPSRSGRATATATSGAV